MSKEKFLNKINQQRSQFSQELYSGVMNAINVLESISDYVFEDIKFMLNEEDHVIIYWHKQTHHLEIEFFAGELPYLYCNNYETRKTNGEDWYGESFPDWFVNILKTDCV